MPLSSVTGENPYCTHRHKKAKEKRKLALSPGDIRHQSRDGNWSTIGHDCYAQRHPHDASLLGLGATAAALMPVLAVIDEAKFSARYSQYHVGLWSKIGVGGTMAIAVVLCVSVSFLLLRYAIVGSSSQVGRGHTVVPFFASAAVASATVVVLAALSQVVYLWIAAIRLRGSASANYVGVHWSPQMWQAVRDAPVSVATALSVFALVFFWQYRRFTRPQ
jgi:hypothetical protein